MVEAFSEWANQHLENMECKRTNRSNASHARHMAMLLMKTRVGLRGVMSALPPIADIKL